MARPAPTATGRRSARTRRSGSSPVPEEPQGRGADRQPRRRPAGDDAPREDVVVVADQRWYRQFLKFGTVGVFNTALELGVFNLLILVHPPGGNLTLLTVYSTLGVVVAIVSSYTLNTRWVFRHAAHAPNPNVWRRRVLFLAQAGVNIGTNDAVTVGVTAALAAAGAFPLVIDRNIAKFAAMFSSSVFSFFVMRHVVFPERRS